MFFIIILLKYRNEKNRRRRQGIGRFTGLPLWTDWVGREALCLLLFPLLLGLAFAFPIIVVGTGGF
jgi:hypothetical protein